ncbi:MAG: DUF494 family protein [Neisseriaceae bacterium]|nr:DUF494 family protein [Neisseriaceae bacterium]MBR5941249.1 DUF494 family protein [Neisseriaceae bacterium]
MDTPNTTPMFEVFSSLFDYFRESEEVSHESILAHLITTGCDPWEIGCATNCLNALFFNDAFSSQKTVQQTAVRVFSKEEQSVLPLEVQDFLHTLSRTGEIQYDERERIIHALMNLPDEEITVENAKLLMLIRLNNAVEMLSIETGEKLLSVFDSKNKVLH